MCVNVPKGGDKNHKKKVSNPKEERCKVYVTMASMMLRLIT